MQQETNFITFNHSPLYNIFSRRKPEITIKEIKKDEIVKEFNEYLSSIGKEYSIRMEEVDDDKYVNETVYFFPITLAEVISTIDVLKANKAAEHDGIKSEILKNIKEEIDESGDFPKLYKIRVATPIFKSGEKNYMDNYR